MLSLLPLPQTLDDACGRFQCSLRWYGRHCDSPSARLAFRSLVAAILEGNSADGLGIIFEILILFPFP